MKISILTATYNRAHTLPRLYKSLISSNHKEQIEWIIMDDGSTDDTESLVQSFIKENLISIQYYYGSNHGKMYAINEIVSKATGDFIMECDSDDYLKDDFYEKIEEASLKLPEECYGMFFLKENQDHQIIGSKFQNEETHTLFDFYQKFGLTGDKTIVFKTKERQKYKYELEKEERFITEGRLFHKMDLDYKGLFPVNEVLMVCEYQTDGYSNNIKKIFKENPYGYYAYFHEMFDHSFQNMPFKKRLYIIKHYILFSYLTGKKKSEVIKDTKGIKNKILVCLLIIPGYYKSSKF